MEVVIAALQHGTQPAGQIRRDRRAQGRAHSSNSIPSSATITPAASTCARSVELRHRIGLVLLIWTRAVRFAPSVPPSLPSCSRLPPGPPTGSWRVGAYGAKLVIRPERAVDLQAVAASRGPPHRVIDRAGGGDVRECATAAVISQPHAHIERGGRCGFRIAGWPPGDGRRGTT